MKVALGIDIGGTKIAVAAITMDGALLAPVRTLPTPARAGGEEILGAVAQLGAQTIEQTDVDLEVVGVGSAGTIDGNGRVIAATSLLTDWTGTDIASVLSREFGVPVVAINDVHAGGYGQHAAAAQPGTTLFVAVGTGIGGALIVDGELVFGSDFTAGSIGHMIVEPASPVRCSCGEPGHLEALASGSGLEGIYREQVGPVESLKEVAQRARGGEQAAQQIIARGGQCLGIGLASAAALINPDRIVVSGGLLDLGELYWDVVAQSFSERAIGPLPATPIPPSVLGNDAVLIGAARWALHKINV